MKAIIIIYAGAQGLPFGTVILHTVPLPGELLQIDDTWYTVQNRDFKLSRKGEGYEQSCVLHIK